MSEKTTSSYTFGTFQENERELERLNHQATAAGFVDDQIWQMTGLAPGMEVLDLACGTGQVTRRLAQRAAPGRVLGMDASQEMLDQAAKAQAADPLPNLGFGQGDIYAVDTGGRLFDFVYVRLLFQHLNQPVAAMKSIAAAMKPGAKLVIVDVDDDWLMVEPHPPELTLLQQAAETGQAAYGGDRHIGRRLPDCLCDAGFSRVRLDVVTLSSFDIGLKNFLDITTRFKIEQALPEQKNEARQWVEQIYSRLDNPRSWGMVAAFVASGVRE